MPIPTLTPTPTSNSRRTYIIVGVVVLVLIAAALVWWFMSQQPSQPPAPAAPKPFVYTDVKGVPQEAAVQATDAKTALTLATPVAESWDKAAKPIFIKSGSDVALDGRSVTWEVAFGVAQGGAKLKAYHVIIEGGQVKTSEPTVTADTLVVPLPEAWSDSKDAIRRAVEILKAPELTVKHMEFYQNTGGQVWRWTLATSKGTVSMTATP